MAGRRAGLFSDCFHPPSAQGMAVLVNPQIYKVMAKSKSFFGLRTGSTKSLTFQVLRGQQITKDRVTKVANPRTQTQMIQRAKLPIVAAARSALKGLVDHSWEGVAYGDASLREFSSRNLSAGALRVFSYAAPVAPSPGIAEFVVSKGSLPGFDVRNEDLEKTIHFSKSADFGDLAKPVFPKMDKGTKGSTVLYYLMKFLQDNNITVLDPGEQLSFLTLNTRFVKMLDIVGGSDSGNYDIPVTGFDLCRLIMPDASKIDADNIAKYTDVNDAFSLSAAVAEAGGNLVSLVDKADNNINIVVGSTYLEFNCQKTDSSTVGVALIESKLVGNTWSRSTSKVNVSAYNLEKRPKFTFDQWSRLYAPREIVSPKFLNKGNEKTGIQS